MILSAKTALGTGPDGKPIIRFRLGGNGLSVDRIRADRILHKALTVGPDPLHLSLAVATTRLGATNPPPFRAHHSPKDREFPPKSLQSG